MSFTHARRTSALNIRMAVAAVAVAISSGAAHGGNLNAEMANMFHEMGALANGSGPGAYRAQGMNIYTGGELQMRTPVRSYQIYSYSLPSIKAGCGGIDSYLGSFSHINKEQFKDMLQQIGNATVGLLFKSALAAINPLIESKLSELGMDIKMEGIFARNSCEMAQSLVNGMAGATGMSSMSSCYSMARSLYGDDDAAARRRCKEDAPVVNSDANNSSDPQIKAQARKNVNILWDAMSGSSLSQDEKELLINVAGTIILKDPLSNGGDGSSPIQIEPSIDTLQVLLRGHQASGTPGNILIKGWWQCDDSACLAPTRVDKDVRPFTAMVRERLEEIGTAMQNRTSLSSAHQAFIANTAVPVHRMLRVGYSAGGAGGADLQALLISRYSNLIAFDYAHTFLSHALKNARVYLGMAKTMGAAEEKFALSMRERIEVMLTSIDAERRDALQRVGDVDKMVMSIERIERQMRLGLGGPTRNMLDFGALMAGKGNRG